MHLRQKYYAIDDYSYTEFKTSAHLLNQQLQHKLTESN